MDPSTLGLQNLDLWEAVRKYQNDLVDKLLDEGEKGIVIAAPKSLAVDKRDSLPILGFQVYDTSERYGVCLNKFAIVVTTDVERNEVYSGLAIELNEAAYDEEPAMPTDYKGTAVTQITIDLRRQIANLPWRGSTLLTTILLFDQKSNTVSTGISPGARYDSDAAVVEFLKKFQTPVYPHPVWPPLPPMVAVPAGAVREPVEPVYPNYRADDDSPPLPGDHGINVKLDRVVVRGPGYKALLRGSFRLAALPREIVPKPGDGKAALAARAAGWSGAGDPDATAVVTITIVAVGNQSTGPFLARLRVPAYDPVPSAEEANVTGSFTVDLFDLNFLPPLPQSYTLWFLSGEVLAGPTLLGIVTEDMLRQ